MKLRAILAASMLLVSGQVGAAIMSADDSVFGIDSITRDTASGFEWLDVTLSINRSFNDVIANLGVGGDFEGWSYAGSYQVQQLLENWTGYPSNRVRIKTVEPFDEAFNLDGIIELLGATTGSVGDGYSRVRGITGSAWDARNVWVGQIHDFDESSANFDYYVPSDFYRLNYSADPSVGSFLVRGISPVPAPPALLLFGTGLLGLIGFGKRKSTMLKSTQNQLTS